MANDCDEVLTGICCCHEVALWRQPCGRGSRGDGIYEVTKVVEDGGGWAVLLQQSHPNSAGSLVIARRTECNPHCFCVSLCCRLPPKLRETAKVYRFSGWADFILNWGALPPFYRWGFASTPPLNLT